jgi:hypothetical protein
MQDKASLLKITTMKITKPGSLLILSMVFFTIYSCNTTTKTPTAEVTPVPEVVKNIFKVTYNSPWTAITIEEGKITKVKTEHHFNDDNFSSVPDSTSTHKLKDGIVLSDSLNNELKKLLDNKQFWELEDIYGASENSRYYPYTISAINGEKSKTVVFRSNPSFGLAPEAFRDIETFLIELE